MSDSKSSGNYDSFYVLGMTTFHVTGVDTSELFHRTDGPALVELDGVKEWWVEGKRHRLDGPAIEAGDTDREDEWWIRGEQYTADEFARIREALDDGAPVDWAISYALGKTS